MDDISKRLGNIVMPLSEMPVGRKNLYCLYDSSKVINTGFDYLDVARDLSNCSTVLGYEAILKLACTKEGDHDDVLFSDTLRKSNDLFYSIKGTYMDIFEDRCEVSLGCNNIPLMPTKEVVVERGNGKYSREEKDTVLKTIAELFLIVHNNREFEIDARFTREAKFFYEAVERTNDYNDRVKMVNSIYTDKVRNAEHIESIVDRLLEIRKFLRERDIFEFVVYKTAFAWIDSSVMGSDNDARGGIDLGYEKIVVEVIPE